MQLRSSYTVLRGAVVSTGIGTVGVQLMTRMREFILVDLESQMAFLPSELPQQPREGFLAWLRRYGEVWEIERGRRPGVRDYGFRSWVGLLAGFTLTDDGRIWLRGRTSSTWLRHDGPRYDRFRQRLAETAQVAKASSG